MKTITLPLTSSSTEIQEAVVEALDLEQAFDYALDLLPYANSRKMSVRFAHKYGILVKAA